MYARVPLYSKIGNRSKHGTKSENIQIIVQNRISPKKDNFLYIYGRASTGFRKSTQKSTKTEKSQKGRFLGREFSKGKIYRRESPLRNQGHFG